MAPYQRRKTSRTTPELRRGTLPSEEEAVAVLVLFGSNLLLLVREHEHPRGAYWKLPGGQCPSEESGRDTAVRELYEEAGVWVFRDQLAPIYHEFRTTHWFALYGAHLDVMPALPPRGPVTGEEVLVESIRGLQQLLREGKILRSYVRLFERDEVQEYFKRETGVTPFDSVS